VPRHQKGVNFETCGNSFADETTQAALTFEVPVFCLILHIPAPQVTPIFIPSEEEQLKKKHLGQLGLNREMGSPWWEIIIWKPLMRELLMYLLQESHGDPKPCVMQFCEPMGVYKVIYILAKQVSEGCT
jgi:hypothetical protein